MSARGAGDPAELLSASQVAALLHRRKQDVLDLIAAGSIPSVCLGRYPRVLRHSLDRWRAACETATVPPPEQEFKPGRHTIPLRVRFAALQRCQFACTYCGRRPPDIALHVDHIVPVAKGGTNRPSNLTAACTDCNYGKRAEDVHLESDRE